MANQKKGIKPATVCAIVIWLISIVAAYLIHPDSPYIWLPDTLLLLGFWPLLIGGRAKLLWIAFGLFNVFIGFVLMVIAFIPSKHFAYDPKLVIVKVHLAQYHSYWAWMIMGVVCTFMGLVLSIIWLILWSIKTIKARRS